MILDSRTALLPIDVQQGFDDPSWGQRNNPAMEAHGQALLAAWRERDWPLIHIHHDSLQPTSPLHPSHPGNGFRPGFEPRTGEPSIGKSVNSGFIGTDLELRLRRLDVNAVVLFGITTDRCVSTTARMASNLGFRTIVVGDATACFDLRAADGRVIPADELARVHLATLHDEFGEVVATGDVLKALSPAPVRAASFTRRSEAK